MGKWKKFNRKFKSLMFVLLGGIMALGMGLVFVNDFIPKAASSVSAATSEDVLNIGNILVNNYASKTKKFDGDQLDKLYEKFTGTKNATLSSLASLFSSSAVDKYGSPVVQSPTIYAKSYNGKTNQDVTLGFGGIDWTVTSLTKDKSTGHYVATLLQDKPSSTTTQWNKWAKWSSDSSNTGWAEDTYPPIIYSTSLMRNEVLNANGCGYVAKGGDTSLTGANTQSSSNKYAIFTMPSVSGSLTDFIVKPANILYQEFENYNTETKNGWTWGNDAYGTPNGTANGPYYTLIKDKAHLGDWKDDYIWLASYSEVASSSVWKLSSQQRISDSAYWLRGSSNGFIVIITNTGSFYSYTPNGSYAVRPCLHLDLTAAEAASVRKVALPSNISETYTGSSHDINTANASAWYDPNIMSITYDDGATTHVDKGKYGVKVTLTDDKYYFEGQDTAVRTAKIIFEITGIKCSATDITLDYDGEQHKELTIEGQPWFNDSFMNITYPDSGNYTDAGTYIVHIALTDANYSFIGETEAVRSKDIKIIINKTKLTMQPFTLDDQTGLPTSALMATIPAYPDRDTALGIEPEFALEYKKAGSSTWTTTPPTVAGTYTARVYIVNSSDCNYVLDGSNEITFVKAKQDVTLPFFIDEADTVAGVQDTSGSGTTLTVQYTGAQQTFKLVNTTDHTALNNVNILACGGGLKYDKATDTFSAKAVGNYTVTISLSDGGANTRWANYATDSSTTRIINLVIEKAKLNVVVENDTLNTWAGGDRTDIVVDVTGVVNDEPVKLNVFYTSTPNGGTTSAPTYISSSDMVNSGGKITVTIDLSTFRTETAYNLYIELDNSATINNNYQLVVSGDIFDFFILTATITKIDVEWNLENIALASQVVSDGVNVDYNGYEYVMSVNDLLLPAGVSYTYKTKAGTFSTGYDDGVHEGTDATVYETVVSFTAEEGYQFASDLQTEYTINWTINPQKIELSTLPWQDTYTWTGMNVHLGLNGSAFPMITITPQNDDTYTGMAVDVGEYDAKLDLRLSETNYIFTLDPANSFGILFEPDGTSATVYRSWSIEKVVVSVSNATNKWNFVEDFDASFNEYKYPVPVLTSNSNAVLVEYFTDRNFTNKIPDITAITVTPGTVDTYYARAVVDPAHEATHKVVNSINGQDYAWIAFTVGDTRLPITVTLNFDENGVTWTGSPFTATAKYGDVQFDITYLALDEDGNYVEMPAGTLPTNVGIYQVLIEPTLQEHKDGYNVTNKLSYLYINPIKANILSWQIVEGDNPTGLEVPEVVLSADTTIPDGSYVYIIVDDLGNEVALADVDYNKNYTITVKVASGVDYFEFDQNDIDAGLTSFSFHTGMGVDEDYETLTKPVLDKTSLSWNGEDQTVAVSGWDALEAYVDVIGSLTESEIGEYTIILRLKSGVNALWEGDSMDDVVLKFQIIPLVIDRPTSPEIRYTGSDINLFDYLDENVKWNDWFVLTGDTTGKNVATYTLTLKIKDEYLGKISWASLTRDAGDDSEITIVWEIKPAQIKGEWKNDKGYLEFVPENETYNGVFEVVYTDADGNQVAIEDFVEGATYTAKLGIADEAVAANYEFVSDSESFQTESEFEYKKPQNFFEKAWEFIKAHWIWFAIGAGVLLLLIILLIIILAVKRKKKKKEEEAQKLEEEKQDETSEEEKQDDNTEQETEESAEQEKVEQENAEQESPDKEKTEYEAEKEKLEQEKADLQKQLEEAKAQNLQQAVQTPPEQPQQNNFASNSYYMQQPQQNPYFMAQQTPYTEAPPQTPQYPSHAQDLNNSQGNWMPSGMENASPNDASKYLKMLEEAYKRERQKMLDEYEYYASLNNRDTEVNKAIVLKNHNDILSEYEEEKRRLQEIREKRKALELSKDKQKINELKEKRRILEVNQEIIKRKIAKKLEEKKDK